MTGKLGWPDVVRPPRQPPAGQLPAVKKREDGALAMPQADRAWPAVARRQISNLPPLAQLPAHGQKRPFYSFELSTYTAQD